MVHDALSAVCGTQVLPSVDNARSKKNHFNFKPNCRAYPSVYLVRLRIVWMEGGGGGVSGGGGVWNYSLSLKFLLIL